ncbi:MAG: L-2-amino-thiazoline-4-carboxylic acid hydrolase [Oscillospiraceae bacterium]|jgi:hypothetical protein|nr:L-2-amino-thiazoline-4-carboxylic acid hydrolase [Oscillospiraceae bacterium]
MNEQSKIKNEPRIRRNPFITALRDQMEHRALWLYFLCDEAEKAGQDPATFAPAAIRRCGDHQGANHRRAAGSSSLRRLQQVLFHHFAREIFEMKIVRCDDDHLDIDFHYCPLLRAWQTQGCPDAVCGKLCDYAMCGDAGIAAAFGCALELPQTIAHGDASCQLRFVRRD